MSNRTYVCFDCRTTERIPTGRITKRCRFCRKAAEHVYQKFKIPRRNDDKGWQELKAKVRPFNERVKWHHISHLTKEQHKIERVLESVPSYQERKRRELSGRLKISREKYKAWQQW
jgi:hypothetical protein